MTINQILAGCFLVLWGVAFIKSYWFDEVRLDLFSELFFALFNVLGLLIMLTVFLMLFFIALGFYP